MSYEISPDQPNAFLFTASNRGRKRALVGRIREFETVGLDKETAMTETQPEWFKEEGQAGVDSSGLDAEFPALQPEGEVQIDDTNTVGEQ